MSLYSRRFTVVLSMLCGAVSSALAASPELKFRTWTDRTGEKQAEAAVTQFDGQTVTLRKANGKTAIVKPAELSAADREYLTDWQRQQAANSKGNAAFPIFAGVISHLRQATLGASKVEAGARPVAAPIFPLLAAESGVLPADLVHVRVSADYLRRRVERAIERQNAISDEILGTQISGWATTNGRTGVKLEPSNDQAMLNVTFTGTIRSRTVGTNGPAILHNYGETVFDARSYLVFAPGGIYATPATAAARTCTHTYDINSSLPGLRGRIVERAAWRKSADLRSQADHIAAQKAAHRIAAALNQEMKRAAGNIQQALVENIRKLATDQQGQPSVHFRSTPDYLHLIMRRPGAADDDLDPPPVEGNPHIAVRIHRSVVRQALSDTQMTALLRPLMTGLVASSGTPQVRTADSADPTYDIQWSPDRNWMLIDYHVDRRPASLANK